MELKERIHNNLKNIKTECPKFPEKNLLIELGNSCNHKCIFCANHKMTRKKGVIDSIFLERILKEAYELGSREVGYYTTGEPLMSTHLEQYIKLAKNIGYPYIYITTNGALATPERIRKLIESGLDSIKFSINAPTRELYELIHGKDDFEKVLENIKYLYELRNKYNLKIKIFVSFILTNYTEKFKQEFSNIFAKYCDEIIFLNVVNQGGLVPEIEKYLATELEKERYDGAKCMLPFNAVTITYEGYLTACCTDFNNLLAIENLNKISLKDAWNSERYRELRKKIIIGNIDNIMCGNCVNGTENKFAPINSELCTQLDFDKIYNNDSVKKRLLQFEENKGKENR